MYIDKSMESAVEYIERHGIEVEFYAYWTNGMEPLAVDVSGPGWNRTVKFTTTDDVDAYVRSFEFANTVGEIRDWVLTSPYAFGRVYA